MSDVIPMQRCTKCGEEKPRSVEFFRRDKRSRDKLQSQCKVCRGNQDNAYYHNPETREHVLAKQKAYNARPERREHLKAYREHYYESHKQTVSEQQRQYYQEHKERIKARMRAYRRRQEVHERYLIHRNEPEVREYRSDYNKIYKQTYNKTYLKRPDVQIRMRANTLNRIARKRAALGKHNAQDIQQQYERQKGKCYYCNKKVTRYHVDHIIPLARGGSNAPDNLIIACPACNQRKQDKLPHEFYEGGKLL